MTKDEIMNFLTENILSDPEGNCYPNFDWLTDAIHRKMVEVKIKENLFYTECPDKRIMNEAAKYRIAELRKEIEK